VRGVPLLTDALACLECELAAEHRAGDHWIVVARVDALRSAAERDPLVFFGGAFCGLSVRIQTFSTGMVHNGPEGT
jgi:flavin reductase (DIM6/NTAB) family NADH-FMN oxidoreductase RutF